MKRTFSKSEARVFQLELMLYFQGTNNVSNVKKSLKFAFGEIYHFRPIQRETMGEVDW